jgi:hypothetical protein
VPSIVTRSRLARSEGALLLALSFAGCARPTPPDARPAVIERPATDASATDAMVGAVPRTDAGSTARGPCAPWATLGRGVSVRRCEGGRSHAAVLFAGWRITERSTRAWAEALDDAALAALGVRALYAVQGPEAVDFRGKELAVDALGEDLERSTGDAGWALLAAHSSGAHVALTLVHRRRAGPLRGRMVYASLDGDGPVRADPERSLGRETIEALRFALFAGVEDRARRLRGFSLQAQRDGARRAGARGALWVHDASGSGCETDLCAHLSLVHARPLAGGNDSYQATRGGANVTWLAPLRSWLAP